MSAIYLARRTAIKKHGTIWIYEGHGSHLPEFKEAFFIHLNHSRYTLVNSSIAQTRGQIIRRCLEATQQADLVFALISDRDCFGTTFELGCLEAISFEGQGLYVGIPKEAQPSESDRQRYGTDISLEVLERFLGQAANSQEWIKGYYDTKPFPGTLTPQELIMLKRLRRSNEDGQATEDDIETLVKFCDELPYNARAALGNYCNECGSKPSERCCCKRDD